MASFSAGSDAIYELSCAFCKDDDLNSEAVGVCVECDVYLCGNCITHHRRNRTSRHHAINHKLTMNCEFCADDGLNSKEEGFCVDCIVYLCETCITHHRRNRTSRLHIIKDKDTMPKVKPVSQGRSQKDETIRDQKGKTSLNKSITGAAFVKDKDTMPKVKSVSQGRSQKDETIRDQKGKTSLNKSITAAAFVKDINGKSPADEDKCWITGSAVVSDNRLVIIDSIQYKVKLVDTNLNKVIHALKVQGPPCDVIVISDDEVAVTVPRKNKILILNVTNVIIVREEINVDGKCYDIAYSQNQLIVSFVYPPRLELINLYGRVTGSIERNIHVNRLFKKPHYVCVSNDGKTIYVSDVDANKVISLTRAGEVKASYTDIEYPKKMCVDHRGNVFVCEYFNKTVHMLTADCNVIKIILTKKDGLDKSPNSVSHCRQTDRLYIGMDFNDYIKVYQLS